MNRREFLGTSLAVVGSATLAVADEPKAALPIVDTHQHLWDLKKFRLPWVKPDSPLNRSYLPEDYAKATERLNVVKSIYMEVDVDPKQQPEEVEYITELCKSKRAPTVAAVVSGRPNSDGFLAYVTPLRDNKYIKGIRQVLHGESTPAGYCLTKEFIKGIQLLGTLGLSFDLCMRAPELPDATKLIDACPETRFILDHCGNEPVTKKDHTQWQRDIAELAKRKNVVGKVSGIVASAKPGEWKVDDLAPVINHTLEVFGPERVMFGGDWPVCTLAATYRQWVEALRAIVKERPLEEQKKLFHDNAVKLYGLNKA
ncbi:MAG TPA: amidohydrolase family protein [Gemmataceae bacterium]|jgi:predicted TIM-barrel fold metal-dependent hydrolase|nr:amidohydrolase family protein [Gemmataceae bacterium]